MNKQELLENYTMEQLADMVVKLEKLVEAGVALTNSKADEINCLKEKLYHKENEIDELKQKLERQETTTKYAEEYVNGLKSEVKRKETTINQIDDILNELFGVTHDIVSKPDEFKEILKTKLDNMTYFPEEPIKVADLIISGWESSWNYKHFSVSELRQIAEHLLVYCNVNESEET